MAATAKTRKNLAPKSHAGSAGYDVVIGPRKKHFTSHADAYRHAMDQQNKGVHSVFVIVDAGTGAHERYRRDGKLVSRGAKNPTIYQALVHKLGRIPTNAELKAEVSRIKKEGYELAHKRKGKKNPESGAIRMRESFTGLPSKKTVVVGEDIHVHSHLAALGELIELKVKTLKGETVIIGFTRETNPKKRKSALHKVKGWVDRRGKAVSKMVKGMSDMWINPRKTNPSGPVLLCSTEDGKQLFIEGGDQTLDLKALNLGELATKESAVIGTVTNITYHTQKKFDGKLEEFDYVHKFSEDSNGLRPMLRYDVRNKHLYLDGGVYYIPKPLIGTSQGITD